MTTATLISKEQRKAVLRRDGFRCTAWVPGQGRCKQTGTNLQVIPVDEEGMESLDNLTSRCAEHS